MPEFRYGVIGRGQWGRKIAEILKSYSRSVSVFDISRRKNGEDKFKYAEKVRDCLQKHKESVDIVWMAVPPGDQDIFLKGILEIHKNVVVEKPWMCDQDATEAFIRMAEDSRLQVAVHYQYCFLDELSEICRTMKKIEDEFEFSGEFTLSRSNPFSFPAIYNLGSHLLAIKCYFFPHARIGDIRTGYDGIDKRNIKLSSPSKEFAVNFLNNKQPIVQRFIDAFEQAIENKNEFPLNLKLTVNINNELAKLA